MSQQMITVSSNALINRKLAPEGETLKTTRGERWRGELGDYYTVTDANVVSSKHIELAEFARELGVLSGSEALA